MEKAPNKISGEYGWLGLTLIIVAYDAYAMKTKKIETLSAALWKSLAHPKKMPAAACIWGILTWHLFLDAHARQSYKKHFIKGKL